MESAPIRRLRVIRVVWAVSRHIRLAGNSRKAFPAGTFRSHQSSIRDGIAQFLQGARERLERMRADIAHRDGMIPLVADQVLHHVQRNTRELNPASARQRAARRFRTWPRMTAAGRPDRGATPAAFRRARK